MTTIVGGLRARLVRDSLYHMLHSKLALLGWFDVNRRHQPINFTGTIIDRLTEVPLNTLVVADEGMHEEDMEIGSNLVETRWLFYVDFYAEDEDIGRHLINDVRDILAGRMSTIGRDHPHLDVYDYRQATPPVAFVVQIENLFVDRAHDFPKPWQKFWYACRLELVDSYGDELSNYIDGGGVPGDNTDTVDGGSP